MPIIKTANMEIGRYKSPQGRWTDTYFFNCECGYKCEYNVKQKEDLEESINDHLDVHDKRDIIETITDKLLQKIED